MFLLAPGIAAIGLLAHHGLSMQWLKCNPVERPANNLANWIQMKALDTEHGRVAMYTLAAYAALLTFDALIRSHHSLDQSPGLIPQLIALITSPDSLSHGITPHQPPCSLDGPADLPSDNLPPHPP